MKLTVKNLGPINVKSQLELGMLNVICGNNNTGKTYLAYSIFGFHHFCAGQSPYEGVRLKEKHPIVTDELVKALIDTGDHVVHVDMEDFILYNQRLFNHGQEEFRNELYKWLGGEYEDFTDCALDFHFDKELVRQMIGERLKKIIDYKSPTLNIEYDLGKLFISMKPETNGEDKKVLERKVRRRLISEFDSLLFLPSARRPFIVTSERMGISLFYKELDASRSKTMVKYRDDVKRNGGTPENIIMQEGSQYAMPIEEEIKFARKLQEHAKKTGPLAGKQKTGPHKSIETMMNARFKTDNNETRLISRSRKNGGCNIPLHRASASSKELTHLYHYLKYLANGNDLLVIDEPESHLSTENQVLLARMLCACVNANIMVLITTHSEIILNEINNNIMVRYLKDNGIAIDKKRKSYAELAGVDVKDVKAFHCANGGVKECNMTKFGIDIPLLDAALMELSDDIDYLTDLALGVKDEQR